MVVRTIFSTFAATGSFYWYLDLQKPIVVEERKLQDKFFVYKEVTGDYWKFTPHLEELKREFADYTVDEVKLGAVYYDNPFELAHRSEGRAVIGGFFGLDERGMAKEFLDKNPDYNILQTQDLDVISIEISFKKFMNYNLSRWSKARSKAYRYAVKNSKFELKDYVGLIEIYPYLNHGGNRIQVMVPYGANAHLMKLTTKPAPKLKDKGVLDRLDEIKYMFWK